MSEQVVDSGGMAEALQKAELEEEERRQAADERKESGFEYGGVFTPWHVSDVTYDLQIIDRLTAMPPHEFFEIIEGDDPFDSGRGPVLMALIGTSLRKARGWSVERTLRTVGEMSLGDVEFIRGDDGVEGEEERPPDSGGAAATGASSKKSRGTAAKAGEPS